MAPGPVKPSAIWPPYMANAGVLSAVALGEDAAAWVDRSLTGMEMDGPEPDHMAVVAFLVVHEHHASVLNLVRAGLMASAMALMRPAFEAYVRGIWLSIADDQQLAQFQRGEQSSDPEKLIKACIKHAKKDRYADLLDTWKQSKNSLHGFVHNSYQSLIRRSGVIDIPDDEVVGLVKFSTGLALHASLEILELAQVRVPATHKQTRPALVKGLVDEIVSMFDRMNLVSRETVLVTP